jgi:hypothetical protein
MAHIDIDTMRERALTAPAPALKPAPDAYAKPIKLPDVQYSPSHQVYFVGRPGALYRGYPSVTKAEGDKMVADAREAADDVAREGAGETVNAGVAHAPAVEHAAASPEVQVDVGAGAADPQIKAHDTSGPDVHVA